MRRLIWIKQGHATSSQGLVEGIADDRTCILLAETRTSARHLISILLIERRGWRAERRKSYGSHPKMRGRLSAAWRRLCDYRAARSAEGLSGALRQAPALANYSHVS